MPILFILIPILAGISSLLLYSHNGKRQILNFDIVQFIYSFVLLPVMFIWLKSLLYFLLRSELGSTLSFSEFQIIDTAFSTLFLFISSFVVIHSLTKSFELQRKKDPLLDLFELSEYFHLTLSHFVIFVGILIISVLLAGVNLFIPLTFVDPLSRPYLAFGLGLILAVVFQLAMFNYEGSRQFFRVIKLIYAVIFLLYVSAYFILNPAFSLIYGVFWTFLSFSTVSVMLGIFAEPLPEEKPWWKPFTLNHRKWVSVVNGFKLVINIFNK